VSVRRFAIFLLISASTLWLTAILLAPTVGRQNSVTRAGAAAIYAAGSFICHQRPERSFHRDDAQLPVCARCTGLYAGGLIGVCLWAMVAGLGDRPAPRAHRLLAHARPRWGLLALAVPTAITVATAWLGWWDPANILRAALAVPLGAGAGAIVSAGAAGDLR
jgi:uncharacterized membrane protein